MTYGWSILIIALALVSLFELGLFGNQHLQLPNSCLPIQGFLCTNPHLSTSGKVSLDLGSIGTGLTITSTGCSTNNTEPQLNSITPIVMNTGAEENVSFQCSLSNPTIGSSFQGYLWLGYSTSVSPNQVQNIGSFSATVENTGNTQSPYANTGFLYVANNNNNTVSIVSLASNSIIKSIPGNYLYNPSLIFITNNGEAYITNYNYNTNQRFLSPINLKNSLISSNIDSIVASAQGITLSPDQKNIYISYPPEIIPVNISTWSQLTAIPDNNGPEAMTTYGGNIIISNADNNTISSYNISTNNFKTIISGGISAGNMAYIYSTALGNTGNTLYFIPDSSYSTMLYSMNTTSYLANEKSTNPLGSSGGIVIKNGILYQVFQSNNTISVVNISTGQVQHLITGFNEPWAEALSINKSYVFVGNSGNNQISYVSLATNTIQRSVGFSQGGLSGIVPTIDGKNIYAENFWGNDIAVMNISTGSISYSISGFNKPEAIALSPNGLYAYVGNDGNDTISVVDLSTNSIISTISGFNFYEYYAQYGYGLYSITVSKTGNYLYVSGLNYGIYSVNLQNNTITKLPKTLFSYVAAISVSNLTNLMYVANNNNITVINPQTGKLLTNINDGPAVIHGMVLVPKSNIGYISTSGNLSIIDLSTNSILQNAINGFYFPNGMSIYSGNLYVVNTNNDSISVVNISTNTVIGSFPKYSPNYPSSLSSSSNYNSIYLPSGGSGIYIINTSSNNFNGNLDITYPEDIAFRPNSNTAYLLSTKNISTITLSTGAVNVLLNNINDNYFYTDLVSSSNGNLLYLTFNRNITVINTSTKQVVNVITSNYNIYGVTPPIDGKIYFGNGAGKLSILNATNYDFIKNITGFNSGIDGLTASPDGIYLYITNYNNTVSVFDTQNDSIIKTITGFNFPIGVAYAP